MRGPDGMDKTPGFDFGMIIQFVTPQMQINTIEERRQSKKTRCNDCKKDHCILQ